VKHKHNLQVKFTRDTTNEERMYEDNVRSFAIKCLQNILTKSAIAGHLKYSTIFTVGTKK